MNDSFDPKVRNQRPKVVTLEDSIVFNPKCHIYSRDKFWWCCIPILSILAKGQSPEEAKQEALAKARVADQKSEVMFLQRHEEESRLMAMIALK